MATFQNVLDEMGVTYLEEGNPHCRAGWIQMDCPFCGRDSRKYHLGYNTSGNYLHCWKCGAHSLISAVREWTGLPWRECYELLGSVRASRQPTKRENRELVLPSGVGELRPQHKRYLRKRGFDWRELEQRWAIQGIGIAGFLSWRIFIPILLDGSMVSWTTRSIGKTKRRYITASASHSLISPHHVLYGEDLAKPNQGIVVHEGPFDVWATGPGSVCVMGLGFTTHQILRLSKYPIRVVCFDNEKEAQQRAKRLATMLEPFDGETILATLDAKDPATASKKELQELRKLAGIK